MSTTQRLPRPSGDDRPAGWQRALRWIAWLTFLGLAIANSDQASFGGLEFLALAVAIGISIFCMARPMGGPGLHLTRAAHVLGEFRPRTNWALVLIGAILVVGGVGASGLIAHDLSTGRATVGEVFEDIGVFIEGWTVEVFTKGWYDAELEKTRAYALCFLLLIGVPLLLFNLGPLWHRRRYRVDERGRVEIAVDGGWEALRPRDFGTVTADGAAIRFEPAEDGRTIVLPQRRVFEREHGARLEAEVSAAFFRRLLVEEGFTLDGNESTDPADYEIYAPVDEPKGESDAKVATAAKSKPRPGPMFTARR